MILFSHSRVAVTRGIWGRGRLARENGVTLAGGPPAPRQEGDHEVRLGRRRLYTHIVVDEAQDLCEMELAFLAAYAQSGVKLFFAGDIGQRIARYSFAWLPFGLDLRGRSRVLKVNYRTTKQIRVMCCDADVIPSPERLAEADVIAGLQEIYDTERNLLYVACTRARDYLLVSSAGIPSELLLDMSTSAMPSASR